MVRRYAGLFGAVVALCLIMSGVAMAKGTVGFTGVKATYTVVKGTGLIVTGKVVGSTPVYDWNYHAPIKLDRYVGGHWNVLTSVLPKPDGTFTFSLFKPATGTYRVRFPGCEHFCENSRKFVIKYNPQLSVTGSALSFIDRVVGSADPMVIIGATVISRLPASYLQTGYMTVRTFGTTETTPTAAAYKLLTTMPSRYSFAGFAQTRIVPIYAPFADSGDHIYRWFKVQLMWSGSGVTTPVTIISSGFRMRVPS